MGNETKPERAGREGDQALPVEGMGRSIHVELAERILARGQLGVRRYGKPLQAFNGRDAFRDLEEELLDGAAYLGQAKAEHEAVVQALLVLARVSRGEQPTVAFDAALDLAEKLEAARAA